MIYATILAQKFDFYILTPVTPENRSNHWWICHLVTHIRCTCNPNLVIVGQ